MTSRPARCRRVAAAKMEFTGMTVLKVENGLITGEMGIDDGVTALQQLGLTSQQ